MIYFLLVSIAWLLVQGVKPGISDNSLWNFLFFLVDIRFSGTITLALLSF